MSALNRPEFFKVFLPHFSSKRMKIPLRFIRHMEGRTSGSVLLSGHSGNTWKVDLMKKKDSLFFDEGWPIFVRDHGINLGEFLLFRYDGNLKFTVTIYDHSACKKEAAVYAKCSQPAYNIAKGKKRARAKAAASSFKSHGDSPKRTKACQLQSASSADNIAKGKKRARAKAATSSFKSHRDSPKRTKGYLETIEQLAAKSFPTKRPFFVICIQKSYLRRSDLHIPRKFLKKHLLSYPEKMVLLNKKGESQLVNIISTRSDHMFSAGWSSFARNNNLKKIPLRFIRHMKGRTSGSVFLTGPSPSGNTWKVDLMKKKDGLFFDEGWPTFVRDHSINLGEFLLFRYDGNLEFTVTIYDHSACKKEAAVYAKCSQPADNIAKGGKKRARAKADTSSLKSLGDLPKRMKGCSDTVEQSAAKSFPAKCPYFVVRIQKYSFHACNLHVPSKFLKEHRLSYHSNEKMVLQNQNGESQEVNIIATRYTTTFCAGWISFVRSSYIKEGDTCQFTLVDKFKMHVNIVPPEKLKFYN